MASLEWLKKWPSLSIQTLLVKTVHSLLREAPLLKTTSLSKFCVVLLGSEIGTNLIWDYSATQATAATDAFLSAYCSIRTCTAAGTFLSHSYCC